MFKILKTITPLLINNNLRNTTVYNVSRLCSTITEITKIDESKLSGFAKAYEKHGAPIVEEPKEELTFAALFENSKFVDLGDPEGKIVTGRIFHIVEDDLYIDFGWKFHCVCPRPLKNGEDFVRGSRVKLRIKDLELSTRFLGSSKDLTILEAECYLIGLMTPSSQRSSA